MQRNDRLIPGQRWPIIPGVGVSSLATSAPTLSMCPFKRTDFDRFLLTILNVFSILVLEHLFGIVYHERGLELYDKE